MGDGAIHLLSSGEVLLGLGKVPYESGKDPTKHWGSYSWEVSEPSGSFPVLNQACQNLYFLEDFWLWWIIKELQDKEFMSHNY